MKLNYFSLGSVVVAGMIAAMLSGTAFAHGNSKTRFVAPSGSDDSDCTVAANPCRTIMHAIRVSSKADKVMLAEGRYEFDPAESILLASDLIEVHGGFSLANGFLTRDVENSQTYVIGVDARYRERLAERGINIVQDRKGLTASRDYDAQINALASAPQAIPCSTGFIGPFECNGLDLLGLKQLSTFSSNPSSGNDIWGHVDLNNGREYALIGLRNALSVVDVTRPRRPREVGSITGPSTTWRDVKTYQFFDEAEGRWKAYAYVTADAVNQGLWVIDLSGLPFSISLVNTYDEFSSAHNIYISNVDYATGQALPGLTPYVYILGSNRNGGAFRTLDISDPVNPVEVTPPPGNARYVHDATSLTITDARTSQCAPGHNPCELFIDFNESTVDIWDTTDKNNPFRISSTPYSGASYTHSGWWSQDKNFIFIQDELDEANRGFNTTLYTLDIMDLTNPFVSNTWTGPTRAIDHNGFTLGNKYYMSNYRRGLTILDVSNPNAPVETAFFDTYPDSNGTSFNGAWGVFPYLPSGKILVSDIERGLVILRETP
jgi:choice-of-anchor B domain-containing protein